MSLEKLLTDVVFLVLWTHDRENTSRPKAFCLAENKRPSLFVFRASILVLSSKLNAAEQDLESNSFNPEP